MSEIAVCLPPQGTGNKRPIIAYINSQNVYNSRVEGEGPSEESQVNCEEHERGRFDMLSAWGNSHGYCAIKIQCTCSTNPPRF